MRPTCVAILRTEACLLACVCAAIACGPTDGEIGALGADAGTPKTVFEEPFANADATGVGWSTRSSVAGASVNVGIESSEASDGRVARLVFPGHPEYASRDQAGVDGRTELASHPRFGYGTHRSRVSWGGCASTEQVAQAVLGYFSDGTDDNGNGLTDEIEIDFQLLCGDPNLAYMTVFTDYQTMPTGGAKFRKLSHVVDLASGRYYDTPLDYQDDFTLSGTDASMVVPDLFQAGRFYEIGFEWHQGSLRFFIDSGTGERTLWSLADPGHVPTKPVQVVYNLWHPDTHWYPRDGAADFPAQDVTMLIDWFRYEGE